MPSRTRRVWALLVLGFIAFSFVRANFEGITDAVDGFFGEDESVAVATSEPSIINLASFQPTSSSSEVQTSRAGWAVDMNPETSWNSGGYAPQWIAIEFDGPATIHRISLFTGQSPDGATTHRIYGWRSNGEEPILHEFSQHTQDQQWLFVTFDEPVPDILGIAVLTTESPSWVAWREIHVYGHLGTATGSALAPTG